MDNQSGFTFIGIVVSEYLWNDEDWCRLEK